jgi:hypothetical protein
LFGPVPTYDTSLPKLLAVAQIRGRAFELRKHLLPGLFDLDRQMQVIAAGAGVEFVSPLHVLCADEKSGCQARASDGTPLQFDESHMTAAGSRTFMMMLVSRPGSMF